MEKKSVKTKPKKSAKKKIAKKSSKPLFGKGGGRGG